MGKTPFRRHGLHFSGPMANGVDHAVRLLLEAGADANRAQRDDPTATPLWHAREDFGLHEIAQLLEKAGAK
jgi:hypothetical protein